MSVNHVVTAGFGTGTLSGDIGQVVLRGFLDASAISGAVSGTIAFTEPLVVSGLEQTIVTLTNDTFVAAGTGPIGSIADTQAFIDGCTSAQAEATGWNAEVRDKEVVGAVARTSATVATITWTAAPAYSITANEEITWTVPAVVLTSAAPLVASPVITVSAVGFGYGAQERRRGQLSPRGRRRGYYG